MTDAIEIAASIGSADLARPGEQVRLGGRGAGGYTWMSWTATSYPTSAWGPTPPAGY